MLPQCWNTSRQSRTTKCNCAHISSDRSARAEKLTLSQANHLSAKSTPRGWSRAFVSPNFWIARQLYQKTPNFNHIYFQTSSPPSSNIFSMCPTTSSKSNSSMPLPPPLTFNSTKIKVKQSALVSPVNGIPTVTPYSGASAVQSCQVQPQQRANREVRLL